MAVLGSPVPIHCFDCCPASSVAILDMFGGFVLMMAAGAVFGMLGLGVRAHGLPRGYFAYSVAGCPL